MKFIEAAQKMEDREDAIESKEGRFKINKMLLDDFSFSSVREFLEFEDWVFIPAKPKILSAEELHKKACSEFGFTGNWRTKEHIKNIEIADKNGQLRAYHEHGFKELVEYCSDTILTGNVWQTDVLENLIKNIKKPE